MRVSATLAGDQAGLRDAGAVLLVEAAGAIEGEPGLLVLLDNGGAA